MTQRRILGLSAVMLTLAWLPLDPPGVQAQELHASARARLPVHAGRFALKVEPGLAFPLTSPQSDLFKLGGGETIKGLFALTPYLDVGPSATFIGLPAAVSENKGGSAWALGGSGQLKRPHNAGDTAFAAISPWLDVDLLYVRTDQLNRAGFAAAIGAAVPIGADRVFWLGPFLRYFEIFNGQRAGFNDNDARILSVGLSLEVSTGIERESYVPDSPTYSYVPTATATQCVSTPCPDRDNDGILDSIDRCPDVAGPIESLGCRQFQKIVVRPDKLELKEKLYFGWDQATLQQESYPILDEVVQALNDNKQFRVQVEGHSSSDGTSDHNQTLSEQRAQAVLDYLVAHGISKDRLKSKGFSSSVPLDTNNTAVGRENNRRVEFVVNFNILDGGSQ
jgi:outer membrane protein OmpA-like peptidoglycan-associated protein